MKNTTKKTKKLSEMTNAEKAHRISRLENTLFNNNYSASALLHSEAANNDLLNNPEILSGIKQLQTLEKRTHVLEQEYNVKLTNKLIPLASGFDQQIKQLTTEYEQDRARILRQPGPFRIIQLAQLAQQHQSEIDTLRRRQVEKRNFLEKHLHNELDECKKETLEIFMRYIRQIYK